MNRTFMICAVLSCLLLILPIPILAAPTVTKDFAFIDNRPGGDLFGFTGLILNLDIIATDPGGSGALTGATQSVKANNPLFPFSPNPSNMSLNAVFPIVGGAEFTRFYSLLPDQSQFPNVTGTYTFTIRDTVPSSVQSTSHNLDKLEVIPIPTNLAFSNNSTTPIFTFTDPDPSPNVAGVNRRYQVLIFDDTPAHANIYQSDISTGTTFTIPFGILEPGETYYFRAQSFDFDPSDFDATGLHSNAENRAIEYAIFQTAPEPTTMLLLGCGLIGLAGYGRKKFFKK